MKTEKLRSLCLFVLMLWTVTGFVSAQSVQVVGRTAFARMEKNARLQLKITNTGNQPLPRTVLQVHVSETTDQDQDHHLPHLAPGESTVCSLPVNTGLRPGSYQGKVVVKDAKKEPIRIADIHFHIVPRPLPNQMPVILWGHTVEQSAGSLSDLKQIGFTHQLTSVANDAHIWENGAESGALPPPAAEKQRGHLDQLFLHQIAAIGSVAPGRFVISEHPEYQRTDRAGKYYPRANADGNFPRVKEFSFEAGKAIASTFQDDPALQAALIHTEIRDGTRLSFTDVSRAAYRAFSGQEIPSYITSPRGHTFQEIQGFPANRVVADNHELLAFYKWFWSEGDGWPGLNSQVNDGLKALDKDRFWTFTDPAIRVPGIWGSGGPVDYISNWTYTYPDPLKIALAGDELFAMAKGKDGQGVMNMTQIIWYRSQTTRDPEPGKGQKWETPEAKFISIAPDHLSSALWLKLTRDVRGIMYHGWGSLTGAPHPSYKLTNPETRVRLTKLLHEVVKPLGPTLLQIPDRKTDVAFLESFASQMFAGRGTYGWGNGWGADAYLVANYAGMQPDIVYDETITKLGLDDYKVLFLMHCDVLTQSIADKISEFQRNGGLVVGDEFLCPAIHPDVLLTSIRRSAPDAAKKALLEKAAALQQELRHFYYAPLESSNREVILRKRTYKNTHYLFAINDHRTYGDYVGPYKLVMEKGLPSNTLATLHTGKPGVVYDLATQKRLPATYTHGKIQIPLHIEGGGGKLLAVLDQPVGQLHVNSEVKGNKTRVSIRVTNSENLPLQAVVPLTVRISDPQNREAEGSGHYGAVDGTLDISLDMAPNDLQGRWTIDVKEGFSGKTVTAYFYVT